jgi:hypothetical protein
VRRRTDDTAFRPIARECPTEDGLVSIVPVCLFTHLTHSFAQDRIEITSENMSSWLVHSPIVQKFTFTHPGGVTSGLDENLDLRPGDVVWIGKQRDRPEVKSFRVFIPGCSVSRPYLRVDRRHLVGRDFVWLSWLSRVVGRQESTAAFPHADSLYRDVHPNSYTPLPLDH